MLGSSMPSKRWLMSKRQSLKAARQVNAFQAPDERIAKHQTLQVLGPLQALVEFEDKHQTLKAAG